MKKALLSAVAFTLLSSVTLPIYSATKPEPIGASPSAVVEVGVINLNTADAETLHRVLTGIGAAKARAIVDYRDAHGPFTSIDELLEVKGIGAATLEKNRGKLSLN